MSIINPVMTQRERFLATMHYQPVDRGMICDFGFWPETIVAWHDQGLPRHVTYDHYNGTHTDRFFGMDNYNGGGPSLHCGLFPAFEEVVLEDRGDHELARQSDGVTVLRKKTMGSIPEHHGHLLIDRASWEQHYKPRLDPSHPDRYPKDWAKWTSGLVYPKEVPQVVWAGSLYGSLRDWMGVEAISYLVYDDEALFEEMVTTMADLIVYSLTLAFAHGAKFDAASMWEDMCYNAGPLLSPSLFKRFLVPHYRRITDVLHANGVDIVYLDCDGKIDDLIPMWLDSGVNTMFPIEVGTWGADPIAMRKKYGRNLRLMGGVDKHLLAGSREPIDAMVHRLLPLVEEGGFIPMPDHRVPPDVPYENYLHYLKTARRVWGRGLPSLRPVEFA
jgi:Uroporphyrinogen decarboxylase (URO-D)